MPIFAHKQGLERERSETGMVTAPNPDKGFHALYLRSGELFTVIPTDLLMEADILNFFVDSGCTYRPIARKILVDMISVVEVGIGCFAMTGIDILQDENRRGLARTHLIKLSDLIRRDISYDPIGISFNIVPEMKDHSILHLERHHYRH
jgi:hypothetical protein